MPKSIFQLKNAIEEIMNDVIQQASFYSINNPQNSDRLNKIVSDATNTTERLVYRLNEISKFSDDKLQQIELDALAKDLKKDSLLHLSALQKIKEKAKA